MNLWVNLLICLAVVSTSVVNAEETQRMRTTFFRFAPTLVNDVEQMSIVIEDLPNGLQFQPLPYSGAFSILTPTPKLQVQGGRVVVTAAFAPTSPQLYQNDILLVSQPAQGFDTLRLRMSGTGYQINRMEDRDFGAVVLGDVDTMVVLARAGLAGNERWQLDPPALAPPFALDPPFGPIQRHDTLVFRFLFAPTRLGTFTDTMRLRRMNTTDVVETIVVALSGRGVRFPAIDTVRLGTLLIGDTVGKIRTFKTWGVKPDVEIAHKPKAPFTLVAGMNDKPIPKPPDSAYVGVSYKPIAPGVYVDSLVMYRLGPEPGMVLDTVSIIFTGSAVPQGSTQSVAFTNVQVGDSVRKPAQVQFPVDVQNVEFAYKLVQIDAGPVVGNVKASSSADVSMLFDCMPTVFATQYNQKFVLYRQSAGRNVDSTTVVVTTTMKARPVHLVVSIDTIDAGIGDTVEFQLRYETEPTTGRVEIPSLTVQFGYDPTIWVPLADDAVRIEPIDDSVFAVDTFTNVVLTSNATSGVLGSVRGVVVMGSSDHCSLPLRVVDSQTPSGIELTANTRDGLLRVTNVWKYGNGKARYVNTLQGMLTVDVAPNPVSAQSTLSVTNTPSQTGRLVIVDAIGQIQADLTADLRGGTTSWTISKGSGSTLTLGTGTYYVRLDVYGIEGGKLYSATRLFVVE